jgi:hypothetical protein
MFATFTYFVFFVFLPFGSCYNFWRVLALPDERYVRACGVRWHMQSAVHCV